MVTLVRYTPGLVITITYTPGLVATITYRPWWMDRKGKVLQLTDKALSQ